MSAPPVQLQPSCNYLEDPDSQQQPCSKLASQVYCCTTNSSVEDFGLY